MFHQVQTIYRLSHYCSIGHLGALCLEDNPFAELKIVSLTDHVQNEESFLL
jgi:hypothetical protein